jgi:hypothetical protein
MASADFCPVSPRNYSQGRCLKDVRVLWLPRRFPQDLNQTPMVTQTATRQTSPDKNGSVPPQPRHLRCPLNHRFRCVVPTHPRVFAFDDVSVRRLVGLPLASSKHSLARVLLP